VEIDKEKFRRAFPHLAQAREIIDYLERKGRITPEYAEKLRRQLKEKGLRSFGPKKEPGYYFKEAGYI